MCLDNFSTGKIINLEPLLSNPNFKLITGDIRNFEDYKKAVENVDFVLHEAALGSVPRSINDPITSNDVNISGFLNMLIASRDVMRKWKDLFTQQVLLPMAIRKHYPSWKKL